MSQDIVSQRVPRKHAEAIKAWADGIDVQYRSSMSNNEWRDLKDGSQPNFFGSAEWRIKPERDYPVTQMTHNEMSIAFCAPNPNSADAARESVANAALRHAIDAGQVVTKADHETALVRLGEQLGQVARKMAVSAVATLQRLGYTDCGGELWKPPLGQKPAFVDTECSLIIINLGAIYGSKRALDYVANCLLDFSPAKRAARDLAVAEAVRNACRNNFTSSDHYIKTSAAYGRISNVSLDGIIAGVRP